MSTATIDEEKLKQLLKSAIVEVLEEHRELIRGIVEEVIEDVALTHAIEQEADSQPVSRDAVFAVLEDAE